jgi:hypothetical protein
MSTIFPTPREPARDPEHPLARAFASWLRLDVGQDVRSEGRILRSRMRPITTNLVFRLQSEANRADPVTRPFRDLRAATLHPS